MEPEKKPNGAVIGLIIIVVILIMGGVYIWQSQVKEVIDNKNVTPTPVSTSDTNDLDSLGKELESTDVNVDVDANSIN